MSTFPLGIEPKQDLPQRLELVQGMPEKYWVPAAHFNKVLEEVQVLKDEMSATLNNDQSSLNASTSLPASANGLKLFCNPTASMTVTLDHLDMASSHENFFINESSFEITFEVLVSNSQDPDYTELVSPNGFVLNQNGTAFLIRKNGTNKLILNISNP